MVQWQRTIRWGLLMFAAVFASGVYLSLREREQPAAAPKVERTDPEAIAESTNATLEVTKGSRDDLNIEYERALAYADGSTRFFGAKVIFPAHGGRAYTVVSREALLRGELNSTERPLQVDLEGDVSMRTSDGLETRAGEASYADGEGMLRVPGPLTFARERMSGSGTGATFDRGRDVLWLLADSVVDVKPDAEGGGALSLRAGRTGLARRDRYLRAEEGTTIVHAGRTIGARDAMIYFNATDDRVEVMELRGGARVTGAPGGAGTLRSMAADDMNLNFGADGRTLTRATLAGHANMEIAGGEAGQGPRRIAGRWLELVLAPDGTMLTGISARDDVELVFPGTADTPSRSIQAARLEVVGEDRGLTQARLAEGVVFRERRAGTSGTTAVDRRVTAESLELALQPGMASIDEARFVGNVSITDGDLTARAPVVRYGLAAAALDLSLGEGDTSGHVQVADGRTLIEAKIVSVGLERRQVTASDAVRTQIRPGGESGSGGGDRLPGLLKQDAPVLAAAQKLVYDGKGGRAEYMGDARLWQGNTAVQGDTIVLDRQKGDMTATGQARSTMMFDDVNDATKQAESVSAIASAGSFTYEDGPRRLTYATGAHVTGPQGDITAGRIELYLGKAESALDRVEAYEQVKVELPGREANGSRLTYFSGEGRYVMSGTPVWVVEELEKECRETVSETLTFFRSIATISADGNQKTRTQTKTGVKCPELRVK